MGAGAFIEPLVVVTLLFGGTFVNRNTEYRLFNRRRVYANSPRSASPASSSGSGRSSPASSTTLLSQIDDEPVWRVREISIMGMKKEVVSPNTRRFQDYFLSRLLKKFPFLVEAWYWALIYWVSLLVASLVTGWQTYLHSHRYTNSAVLSVPSRWSKGLSTWLVDTPYSSSTLSNASTCSTSLMYNDGSSSIPS